MSGGGGAGNFATTVVRRPSFLFPRACQNAPMGRLVFSTSVSLDGFVDTPTHSLVWVLVDEELHSFFNDQSRELRASLYGRRMHEVTLSRGRFFPLLEDGIGLRLRDTRTFSSGVVYLRYDASGATS
jgi:hypothetical protein